MWILFLILGLASFGASLYIGIKELKAYKLGSSHEISKPLLYKLIAVIALHGTSGAFFQACIDTGWSWPMSSLEAFQAVFGMGMFFLCFALFIVTFFFRYYILDLNQKFKKPIKIANILLPFVTIGFFLLGMNGVANYLTYPLTSGFQINGNGFSFVSPATGYSGFHVAWYAFFILGGAYLSYRICDHRFYKEYGKHGIIENMLIFVLFFGILGARVWYVVGNWTRDGFDQNFIKVFQIWNGGLTILGGAIAGIISGILFIKLWRKYVDVRFAMDVIVPTILIAQAIGRWGNFFNCEVYGAEVAISNGWSWLPSFIQNQMAWSSNGTQLSAGMIHVPLFLVEGMLNIAGYFLIAWLIPIIWKKKRARGVLAGFYLIWYGAIRMPLELLRDTNFNMGDGSWSFWNAMIYIILGLLLIAGFEIWEYVIKPRRKIKAEAIAEDNEAKAEEPLEEESKKAEKQIEIKEEKKEPLIEVTKEDEKADIYWKPGSK